MARETTVVIGVALDEDATVSLAELCAALDVDAEVLIAMVEEGVLDPVGGSPPAWLFRPGALRRARIAMQLQRDLNVNLPGAALTLDMLEELERLRRRVLALERQLLHD